MQLAGLQNSSLPGFALGNAAGAAKTAAPAAALPDPVPNRSDLLFNALFVNKKAPALQSSGPIASLRARDAIRLLSIRTPSPTQASVSQNIDANARFRELKITRLGELADSLAVLKDKVGELLAPGALSLRSARSSDPDSIRATAGENAPLSRTDVTPTRLAAGEVLVSDEQADSALGLSGSFFINGFKVTVEAGDSLFSIRDKINFGEDRNKNGTLDGPEDVNANGVLESYGVAGNEFGGSLFVDEDLNGSGTLDGAEDANGNGRLDGGILETRVIASVTGNRLTLTSVAGGDTRIDLRDEDDVLLGLGFFERDRKGLSVQKETQFDSGNPPANLIRNPQTARIEVEGKTQTNHFNSFDDVIDDTTLTVKRASGQKVQIEVLLEASQTAASLETLFDRFNSAVRNVNDLLAGSKTFQGDADVKEIRTALTGTAQEKTQDLDARNQDIDRVRANRENQSLTGFAVANGEKNNVAEVALTAFAQSPNDAANGLSERSGRALLDRLDAIGIRTLDDDTLAVDSVKLKRALTVNPKEVLDLFENSETGILPVLENSLSQILDPDSGAIALKQKELSAQTDPNVSRSVRAFSENARAAEVSNLIAVV